MCQWVSMAPQSRPLRTHPFHLKIALQLLRSIFTSKFLILNSSLSRLDNSKYPLQWMKGKWAFNLGFRAQDVEDNDEDTVSWQAMTVRGSYLSSEILERERMERKSGRLTPSFRWLLHELSTQTPQISVNLKRISALQELSRLSPLFLRGRDMRLINGRKSSAGGLV